MVGVIGITAFITVLALSTVITAIKARFLRV